MRHKQQINMSRMRTTKNWFGLLEPGGSLRVSAASYSTLPCKKLFKLAQEETTTTTKKKDIGSPCLQNVEWFIKASLHTEDMDLGFFCKATLMSFVYCISICSCLLFCFPSYCFFMFKHSLLCTVCSRDVTWIIRTCIHTSHKKIIIAGGKISLELACCQHVLFFF